MKYLNITKRCILLTLAILAATQISPATIAMGEGCPETENTDPQIANQPYLQYNTPIFETTSFRYPDCEELGRYSPIEEDVFFAEYSEEETSNIPTCIACGSTNLVDPDCLLCESCMFLQDQTPTIAPNPKKRRRIAPNPQTTITAPSRSKIRPENLWKICAICQTIIVKNDDLTCCTSCWQDVHKECASQTSCPCCTMHKEQDSLSEAESCEEEEKPWRAIKY